MIVIIDNCRFGVLFVTRNRRIAVFGARKLFCLRALHFLIENDFVFENVFDAEATDADASIDRGARKRSKNHSVSEWSA